jgi:polysaccharide pyruvyl transferase CsaB
MRLLISGYYGFGNTGDEAVLAAMIDGLRRHVPSAELCVLSGNPALTAREYGVQAADRWRTGSIWHELRQSDFLIQGGGGLLQDTTSHNSAMYYLSVLHLARLARRPYMVFAQGIGPLNSPFLRGLTARALRRAKAITVRDEGSAQMLRDWGVRKPEISVTADPGLLLESADEDRRRRLLSTLDLRPDQPYMAIALRAWPGLGDFLPHLVELLRQRDEALLVLPFQFEQDLPLALELSRALPTRVHLPRNLLSPADALSVIRGSRAVIAMRLHAMIFAASQCTPALALAYDPKVDAFCHEVGQPVLQLREATTGRLAAALEECQQEDRMALLQSRLADLKQAAEHNFEILASVLPQKSKR